MALPSDPLEQLRRELVARRMQAGLGSVSPGAGRPQFLDRGPGGMLPHLTEMFGGGLPGVPGIGASGPGDASPSSFLQRFYGAQSAPPRRLFRPRFG